MTLTLQEQIENYQMSETALAVVQKTPLLLIASVVGGGKNTIINELLKSGEFHRIISHTTRAPRMNHDVMEMDGQDYYFISPDQAAQMLTDHDFIEAKYVHGNVYGTSVAEVQAAHDEGRTAVTDIDIQGVVEYLDVKPNTHAVFLLPPSPEVWLKRLKGRYGNLDDHKEEITKRFRTAHDEIKYIQEDKRFVLIVNDDLVSTVERVKGVLDGSVLRTSDYAEETTHDLIDFLETKI